jgi:RNA recognition motif-containing protein
MSDLESKWRTDLSILKKQEAKITDLYQSSYNVRGDVSRISVSLNLAEVKLLVAQKLAEGASKIEANYAAPKLTVESREKIMESLRIIEGVFISDPPENHTVLIKNKPGIIRYKILLRILTRYENIWNDLNVDKNISRRDQKNLWILTYAFWKYSDRDDNYKALIDLKKLGKGTRWILRRLFPVLLKEFSDEPCGIEESDVVYYFKNTVLPLSQAVSLIEEELLPVYLDKLAEDPENRRLKDVTSRLGKSLNELKKIQLRPRGTPIIPEQDFWNEVILGTDNRGELLVTVDIPSSIKSGTNQDRTQSLIKFQILKTVYRKGICKKLDEDIQKLKSYKSGTHGRKYDTVSALDVDYYFGLLADEEPLFKSVNNPAEFSTILSLMRKYGFRATKRYIRQRFISVPNFERSIKDIRDNVVRLIDDTV